MIKNDAEDVPEPLGKDDSVNPREMCCDSTLMADNVELDRVEIINYVNERGSSRRPFMRDGHVITITRRSRRHE